MSKYKIFSTTTQELKLPQDKPLYNLDLVNSQTIPPEYTFTRNSAGTYIGADGLIKTAAANEPRFDYDPTTGEFKGLLVEESRRNIFFPSKWGSDVFPVSAPDGSTTGKLIPAYTNPWEVTPNNSITLAASTIYTISMWVYHSESTSKTFVENPSQIFFYTPDAYVISSTNTSVPPNTWRRYSVTFNSASGSGNRQNRVPTYSFPYYAFGRQIEVGSYATSYIPTTGSAVTRQPDQLVLNRPFNSLGTFFVESNKTTGTTLSADNGTSSILMSSTGKEALYYNTNRTLRMPSDSTPSSYNSAIPQDLNRVSLGHNALQNSQYINGYLKKFMYYGSPVTEDNLRSLTGNTLDTFRYGDDIVTNGLVLYLDAGNRASYPGSGTTWFDLSGNGNNGTLVNGVGYDNGGSLIFDGVNDVISGSTASLPISTTVTVAAWIKHDTLPSSVQRYLTVVSEVAVIRKEGNIGGGNATLHFYIKTNGSLRHIRVNNQLVTNTWYYIVGTWDGTTQRLYKNAVQIGANVPGGVLNGGNLTYFASASSESLDGNIAQVSVYNRALTQQEIQQNFNALRGRFGI